MGSTKATLWFRTPGVTHTVCPPKIGRNDPCPCGSGKKVKKCCGEEKFARERLIAGLQGNFDPSALTVEEARKRARGERTKHVLELHAEAHAQREQQEAERANAQAEVTLAIEGATRE